MTGSNTWRESSRKRRAEHKKGNRPAYLHPNLTQRREDAYAPSFATHRLRSGSGIRTVQDLPALVDVAVTRIYRDALDRPGLAERSPLDA